MSQFFASGGQSIAVSSSVSVLPMNMQDWFPLGWTGWISLQSKGHSRVFSNTKFKSINERNVRFDLTKTHWVSQSSYASQENMKHTIFTKFPKNILKCKCSSFCLHDDWIFIFCLHDGENDCRLFMDSLGSLWNEPMLTSIYYSIPLTFYFNWRIK